MPDITRFDFHAMRFMYSEDVRSMTAEEVGQYILLLCESWLGQKDASLPTDKNVLARMARSEKVSPLVLKKFDLVDTPWGKRFRNETLFAEWERSVARSDSATKAVNSRWRGASVSQPSYERNTDVLPAYKSSSYPNQTKPIHTKPDQTKATHDAGEFKFIASRFRAAFGFGSAKSEKIRSAYARACEQYGEDVVLDLFARWAKENQWVRDKRAEFGLNAFFGAIEEMIEAHSIVEQENKTVEAERQQSEEFVALPALPLTALDEAAERVREEQEAAERITARGGLF